MVELFEKAEQCCGCTACLNICPKQAISMLEDQKGFLYPKIDGSKCVECGLCQKVCPFKVDGLAGGKFSKIAYAVKNKDNTERAQSSSGAVFIEVAKAVLGSDGVVYGVRLDDVHRAMHDRASSIESARKFQGSKYVQSYKGSILQEIKRDLKAGNTVLFTGTPCEVAGLKRFLGVPYDNLVTVDIICHGTPSPGSFDDHIRALEKKYSSKISKISFRNKQYGWRNQELWIKFNNGEIYHNPIWEDEYYRLFTGNYLLRDSCYSCPFASMNRPGDITIGDFWNINNVKPDFEDKLGVSSIIVNTEKGQDLITEILTSFEYYEVSLDECTQRNLQAPSPKPDDFDSFRADWEQHGLDYCRKKYASMGFGERIRRTLSPVKKRVMKVIKRNVRE